MEGTKNATVIFTFVDGSTHTIRYNEMPALVHGGRMVQAGALVTKIVIAHDNNKHAPIVITKGDYKDKEAVRNEK